MYRLNAVKKLGTRICVIFLTRIGEMDDTQICVTFFFSPVSLLRILQSFTRWRHFPTGTSIARRYPWGQEAFDKAKKEDKLIFLSVGYSTCQYAYALLTCLVYY